MTNLLLVCHFHGAQVASLTARITVDTDKIEYLSGPGNSNFRNGRVIYTWTDPNGGDSPLTDGTIATFTFIARAGGIVGFSVSGDFYAPDESELNINFSGVTVTVNSLETPEPIIEITPEPTAEPVIEDNPAPTQLTLNPNPIPTNSQSVQEPIVTERPTNDEERLNTNTNLKSLRLDVTEIVPEFSKDVLQYSAIVNEEIKSIDVLAVPEEEKSSIEIIGNNDLSLGENLIQVTVRAENGDQKTYNITINKTDEANESNSYLENLAVEGVFLEPEFRYNEFNYIVEIDANQNTLNILATPQIEGAKVEIIGNENLELGSNKINIIVTSKNGATTNTYTINAYKRNIDEERNNNEIVDEITSNTASKMLYKNNEEASIVPIIITIGIMALVIAGGILLWKKYKNMTR